MHDNVLSENFPNLLTALVYVGEVLIVVHQILKSIVIGGEDGLVRLSVHLADNLAVLVEEFGEAAELRLLVEKVPHAEVHQHERLVDDVDDAVANGDVRKGQAAEDLSEVVGLVVLHRVRLDEVDLVDAKTRGLVAQRELYFDVVYRKKDLKLEPKR